MVDDRLQAALHELLRARSANPESTPLQQQRAENILICLLFPHALTTANIAAKGAVAPPELARRTSAILTTIIRRTTAHTPAELMQELLADIHRRFAPPPGQATRTPTPRPRRHLHIRR